MSSDEAHLQIAEFMSIGAGHSVSLTIVWIVRKIL